jgi:hypothetical protein
MTAILNILKFFLVFNILLTISCNEVGVKNYGTLKKFVNKAEKTPEKIKAKDWESMDAKFEVFINDYNEKKDKMSKQKRKEANQIIGKYYALRVKQIGQDFGNEMEQLGEDLQNQINGAMDVLEEENVEN